MIILCFLLTLSVLAETPTPAPAAPTLPDAKSTSPSAAIPAPAPEAAKPAPVPAAPAAPLPQMKPLNTDPKASDFQQLDATDPTKKPIQYSKTAAADNASAFEPMDITKNIITTPEKIELPPVDPKAPAPLTKEESEKRIAALEQEKTKALATAQVEEDAKAAAAAKEADLFEYNLAGLKEAGVDVSKNGFGITSKIGLWDGQYIRSTFALNTEGFLSQSYLKELKIGKVLTITGVGPDGKYGTADDGAMVEIRISKDVQRFTISGLIDFLGAMSETEVIISPEFISLLSKTNLFGLYKTIFLAEFKPADLDFLVAAAIELSLMQYIEDQVSAALEKAGDAIASGGRKGVEGVQKAQADLDKFQSQIDDYKAKIDQARKDLVNETNAAQKQVDVATRKIEDAEAAVARELGKINDAKKQLESGRGKIDEAQRKVDAISSEADDAYEHMNSLSHMQWYEVAWKYPQLVFWTLKYASVQAARGVATAYLQTAKLYIAPISAALTATYALSYGVAKTALIEAYGVLKAARVAANPKSIEALGKIIGYGLALNEAQMGYYYAQGALLVAQGSCMGVEQVGKGIAIASKAIVSTLLGGIFRIDGGGFKCLLSDLKKGIIDLYLIAVVFGTRKNLKLSLDMANPGKTLASIGGMIVDILDPTKSGGASVFDDIEEARKKFAPQLAEIEQKQKALVEQKNELIQQKLDREAVIASISAETDASIAQVYKKYPLSAEDIKAMGTSSFTEKDESASIVDETNPINYTINNMKNTFRWLDKWKLPSSNSGTVIFDVIGTNDVCIGFHHTANEKVQKTNRDFDIILGSDNNTKTLIRDKNTLPQFSTSNPDFLLVPPKDNTSQSFWVSFDKGYIAVGRGRTPGQNLLFDWQMNTLTDPITHFSFSSAKNQLSYSNITTAPAFVQPFGSRYSSEGGFNQFNWFTQLKLPEVNKGTVLFKARAKESIVFGLSDALEQPAARYIATIGTDSNTKTTLATMAADFKTSTFNAVTADANACIPNATEFNPYWAVYDNGHFVIGTGTTPSQKSIIIEMVADDAALHPIQYFSFSSWSAPVEIKDITVQPAVMLPTGTRFSAVGKKYACDWKKYWALPQTGSGTILWQGKGLSDMGLALHTTAEGKPTEYSLMCLIGADKNSRTLLQDATQKLLTQTTDPESLISNQSSYNDYWFSYDQGYCRLGTGSIPGENSILEYEGAPLAITHFSFTNNLNYMEFKNIITQPAPTQTSKRGQQYSAAPQSSAFFNPAWTLLADQPETLILCAIKTKTGFSFVLSQDAQQTKKYTLSHGGKTGTTLSITGPDGAELFKKELDAPCISDSYNFYPYWILYNKQTGTLSYGSGITPGKSTLGSAVLPGTPALTSFGIQNITDDYAYFKTIGAFNPQDPSIAKQYAAFATLTVFNIGEAQQGALVYQWKPDWKLATPQCGTIQFTTKSSDSIAVALGNPTDGAVYEIIIGSKQNTETVICKNKTVVSKSIDPAALIPNADDNYSYWINVYKGQICVGTGTTPLKNVILEWNDPDAPKTITHFSLTSDVSHVVFDDIAQSAGTKVPLYQNYSACCEQGVYNWLAPWVLAKPESGCITFEVKTKEGALIALGKPQKPIYTFNIGSSCAILKNNALLASITGTSPSATEYTPYWIMYDKGYCGLGTGTTPSADSLLVEYQDLAVIDVIQNFSMSSSTGQATYHAITSMPVPSTPFKRNASFVANGLRKRHSFGPTWSLNAPNSGTLVFDGTGAGPYYIGLDDRNGGITDPRIEIVIGANDNTETQIRKNGAIVEAISDPLAIINIPQSPSAYWVTMKDNVISVGSGSDPSKNTFISWADVAPEPVTFFSFSSDQTNVRYKHIQSLAPVQQAAVNQYVLAAGSNAFNFNKAWHFTTPDAGSISFKAKGKNDIRIGLSAGINNKPRYEVIIGANKNNCTQIAANGTVVASMDSDEALIRSSLIPIDYWVSYSKGTIAVGLGTKPGEKITLVWSDPNASQNSDGPITHVAFANNDAIVTLQSIAMKPPVPIAPESVFTGSNQNGSMTWRKEWRITPGRTIVFDVIAPHGDLYVGLGTTFGALPVYTCRIGGWQNTKTAIMSGTTVLAEGPDKIDTVSEKMWICYREGSITIGTGEPHTTEIVTWKNTALNTNLQIFGFASGTSSVLCENIAVIPAAEISNPKKEVVIPPIQMLSPTAAPSPAPSAASSEAPAGQPVVRAPRAVPTSFKDIMAGMGDEAPAPAAAEKSPALSAPTTDAPVAASALAATAA